MKWEIRKLLRRPYFLFLLALIVAYKLAVSFVAAAAPVSQLEQDYTEIVSRYAAMTLDKAARALELERAPVDLMDRRDFASELAEGIITQQEFTQLTQNASKVRARSLAYLRVERELRDLKSAADASDAAKRGELTRDLMYWDRDADVYMSSLAQWGELRLVPPGGWDLYRDLSKFSIMPYALLLLLIPMFTDLQESGIAEILIPTKYGYPRAIAAKVILASLCTALCLAVDQGASLVLPLRVYGLPSMDYAAQSLTWLRDLPYGWTIGQYVVHAALNVLMASMIIAMIAVCVAMTTRSSWKSTIILLFVFLGLEALSGNRVLKNAVNLTAIGMMHAESFFTARTWYIWGHITVTPMLTTGAINTIFIIACALILIRSRSHPGGRRYRRAGDEVAIP